MNDYIISNITLNFNNIDFSNINIHFYGNFKQFEKTIVKIDGYVYLRQSGERLSEFEIFNLFEKYKKSIVYELKGVFVIIISTPRETIVFNDHLGIRKFFYSKKSNNIIISNSFWLIKKNIKLCSVNNTAIAIHALSNHFLGGQTIYKEIVYSKPATILTIDAKQNVDINSYWELSSLLRIDQEKIPINNFADNFIYIVKRYSDQVTNKKIKLTLTGGLDSRLILASLLKTGNYPNAFTYGLSESNDVVVAQEISKRYSINFYNPKTPDISSEWFYNQSQLIKKVGNSIVSYHRAYRWDGILKAINWNEHNSPVFTGFLGGEGIRGAHFDNLIITNFVIRWAKSKSRQLIIEELENNFIDPNKIDIEEVENELNKLPYFSNNSKHNEFYLLFQLNASNHLAQDINYYIDNGIEVILPYMDIDYLEILFSSQFSMLHKDNTSKNQLKRLNIPDFHCKMINAIYPDLTNVILTNGYKPSEYIMGKIPYMLARGFRKFTTKRKQSNFIYGDWFKDYLFEKSKNLVPETNVFDYKKMTKNLSVETGTTETQWHKYTSVIMVNDMLKERL